MSGESSYVKNLGQVSAIVFGNTPPEKTFLLWYDENESTIKYYDLEQKAWVPLFGSSTTAENLQTDAGGLVFKQKVGSVLYLRRITGENGISVQTEGNDIKVSLVNFLETDTREVRFDSQVGIIGKLRVSSNLEWEVIGQDEVSWLSFNISSGFGSQFLEMTVTELNPTTTSREGSIIIRSILGEVDDVVVFLVQEGSEVFTPTYLINSGDYQCEQE